MEVVGRMSIRDHELTDRREKENREVRQVRRQSDDRMAGDKKEEERMQQKTDMDASKKPETTARGEQTGKKPEAEGEAKPKKKNVFRVIRKENSKTGWVPGSGRPRQQGKPGQPGTRPAGAKPANPAAKPQGGGPAKARDSQEAARTAGARPQDVRPQSIKQPETVKAQNVKQPAETAVQPENVKVPAAPQAGEVREPAAMKKDVSGVKEPAAAQKQLKQEAAKTGKTAEGKAQPQTPEKTVSSSPAVSRAQQSGGAKSPAAEGRNQSSQAMRGQDGGRGQGGRSQDGGRGQGSRSQDGRGGQGNRSQDGRGGQGGRSQDNGRGGQGNRSQDGGRGGQGGRFQDGGRGEGSRRQDGRGGQGGRSQDGGRGGQGGRFQDGGRGSQGNRSQDGRGGQGSRSQDGRGGQGNRGQGGRGSMGIPKPPIESKPLEKESRKRTERGDRNRNDKGEKLDRLERTGRAGQKNSQGKGNAKGSRPVKPAVKPAEKPEETIRNIVIPEKLTIKELGEAMKVQPSAIVKKLFLQGVMVTVNEEIDFDKAEEIALEFNCICEKEEKVDVLAELLKEEEEDEAKMVPRSPVVCVMGHVDHGKTSLLDAIRNTHVIDKEAGGITQHIGAYVVSINGERITFLDTPGHEAFTAMRMRGANATDIAILVVAADDGVMPQTVEAISHAKAAGTEIIVAINKIDKPSANVERVKQELSEYELIPEDWGGSTVFVPVSAHTHEGIDNLLEMILLTAEVAELRANPDRRARGLVIEAELDKGKGPVATVLVQKGTLHVGDPVAAGACFGKVRAMMDDKGRRVKEAGPSTPVEILGLSDVPNAGEIFVALENDKEARTFAETFISESRERMLEETKSRMSLDDLFSQIQAGNLKELDIIVKADVQGSVEAVKQSLLKLSNEEVVVKIIHGGVGAINESDVSLASASNAIIIGFNVRPDAMAKASAEREGVDVRLYRVIYDAIADVEAAMKGMLDPIFEEKITGHAEVRQIFRASGVGNIAGSYVTDGVFQRSSKIRIMRDDKVIYEGALASLKRFKDDVKEVRAGYECGLVFEKFNDIMEGDKVEAYTMVEVPR